MLKLGLIPLVLTLTVPPSPALYVGAQVRHYSSTVSLWDTKEYGGGSTLYIPSRQGVVMMLECGGQGSMCE